MIKSKNAQQPAKTNEQAERDLASLSDQELVPALLEQVVDGAALPADRGSRRHRIFLRTQQRSNKL